MKKVLLFFAAMCCMMVANAQQFEDANGIKYNVTSTEDKTVEVISKTFAGYAGDIVIPATVTNEDVTYNVTSIGNEAFDRCDLTSVTLPNGLESIGYNAFNRCLNLASINIPGTVTSIGEGAFEWCETITSVTIPSGVKSIGKYAFNCCLSLLSISVDESNTTYDSRDNCNAIIETATNTLIQGSNNTVIPSSVTAIGDYAFYYNENITSITLPDGLKSIGYDAFGYCTGLASVIIPGSVECLDQYAFCSCENLESVTLSNGLKSIGYYAFGNCKKLTSVTIPGTVTEIGDAAFEWCTGLTSITVLASTPPTLGGGRVFYDVPKSIIVYVPDVDAYSGWGGFSNFHEITIDIYKQLALDEIDAAMSEVTLSAEEEAAIDGYITAIEGADNLTTIENAKNAALAIISQVSIRIAREAAITAIEAAMQGETSTYITGLAQQYINIINAATDVTTINNARNTALVALNAAVAAYKAGKGDAFGSLGEKQNGPAIEVIKDGERIILYRPDRVNFIRANN